MTHEDIVYDRRVRLIEHAAKIGNVAEACRVFGVSRNTYYEWVNKAERYGLSALLPKERRKPHQPNAMSSVEVAVILSEAVARPTLGPKSLLRHLAVRGVDRSASGVAKVLRRHNLGTARVRIAALASLTAADTGQVSTAAMELFFDQKPAAEAPWTSQLWVYDFRTNQHFTLKQRQLRRADLDEFVSSFASGRPRDERKESDRFRAFDYDELVARDKANLDITWLKDDSLEDIDNLPAPEIIAREIVEDLTAALVEFEAVAAALEATAGTGQQVGRN